MNLCRTCLSLSANRDIRELKIGPKNDSKSYSEIFLFCLNIQITESTKLPTKLCNKCYRKILNYYKFKTLALENDTYIKTLKLEYAVKQETYILEDQEYSNNNYDLIQVFDNGQEKIDKQIIDDESSQNGKDLLNLNFKKEQVIKIENYDDETNDYESDNELLSVIKQVKEENSCPANTIPIGATKVKAKVKGRSKIKKEPCAPIKQICEECGESVKDLKQHSVTHLPMQDRKRIPCKLCDKKFCSYSACYKHKNVKHLGIKHQCQECGKEVANLKSHLIRIHHPEMLKVICVMCDKRFVSQSLLDIHMLKHTKDRPYECDICKKRFRVKVTMELHKRQVHELERSHLCQYCPKTFFKKYHLDVHVRSHTKEKPYKCEQCGRAFSDRTTWKNHQDTHKTERNFHCEHCDMKFVRRDYLRVHLVCHTKEKRYPCKYCGLRFGRSDHRKRHQYTAHEKHVLSVTAS